jgi:hypothetical protein
LHEISVDTSVPIESIAIQLDSDIKITSEIVDSLAYKEKGGELEYSPIYIESVTQGNAIFVEYLDYRKTESGIVWLCDKPPIPYTVTYAYRDSATVALVE